MQWINHLVNYRRKTARAAARGPRSVQLYLEMCDRRETTAAISLSALGMAAPAFLFSDASRAADVEYVPFALLDQTPPTSDADAVSPSQALPLAPATVAAVPDANAPAVPAVVMQAPFFDGQQFTADPLASDATSSFQGDLFALRLAVLGFMDADATVASPQAGPEPAAAPPATTKEVSQNNMDKCYFVLGSKL